MFVSIGYSSCHWCHVMAAETFSDPAVAALVNESFVAIKVDREEHPDVDQAFMRATQSLTGQEAGPTASSARLTGGPSPAPISSAAALRPAVVHPADRDPRSCLA